jgi:GNAT superfamily N-acetyltransferase
MPSASNSCITVSKSILPKIQTLITIDSKHFLAGGTKKDGVSNSEHIFFLKIVWDTSKFKRGDSVMDTLTMKELQSHHEIIKAFPIIKQLRSHLDERSYLDLVTEAQEKESYKMFALFDHDEMVAVIGFQPMITLYYGRFVWVCDLVTDTNQRAKGYGKKLLTHVHEWALTNKYERIALSSGLQRMDAHRFYEEKMNYDKVSYVFTVSLK